MLDAADTRSLALLYHLNSEPSLTVEATFEDAYHVEYKELPAGGPAVPLPADSEPAVLAELIGRRSSCRAFAAETLALADLGALLAGSYGLGGTVRFPGGLEARTRPVPSAGALYPLELYLALRQVEGIADAVYHYNVLDHALERLSDPFARPELAAAVIAAPLVEQANALVFLAAVFDRTLHKYGARGYRYILLEAGHVAQNLCLIATERGLASLCVGGFMDAAVNRLLGLDPRGEAVLYCVAIGHAGEGVAPGPASASGPA